MSKPRVGVLISGRGSNMEALIKAAKAPDFPAEIVLVLSNKPEAAGLEIARALGVAAEAVPAKPFGKDREAHERALDAKLQEAGVEIVCLAGYMRLLTPYLVNRWAGRMLNIHPSLLPEFPGLDTHARAIEAGAAKHGCTVHLVTEGMDEGPVVAQAEVPVLPNDTEDALAARVLAQEHIIYPRALAELARKIRLPQAASHS
ncbi:phosphoribosylglycinamide formyltransferase [Acidocella aromatica]|uniref:Phosphoribosylglycinamide formyltransferase n=1 Tax=Acidocella aromatica TaxID=1303579 RepID=A0A840VE19_9PROT|nr:phosphoribosylglycinamide formyltransferase [Acidocella aromatica]MBB5374103.1 formyltetrahydrofolate-dependent phosphoribosylglycinamide formyltransferase [Acidocella aromatica]